MNSTTLPVYAEHDPPWVYLTFDWHPDVIDAFKDELPNYSRAWLKEERAWRISQDRFPDAQRILENYGYHIFQPKPISALVVTTDDHKTLFVAADAPHEVVRAAYRALAKIHHPDIGGDPKKMQEINEAWRRLDV